MATQLVFVTWIIAHLANRLSCGKCGLAKPSRTIYYPTITRRENQVELRFRVRCACGQGGSLRVQLPVLLFGYILAQQAMLEAHKRGRTSVASMQVMGHESKLFSQFVREYVELIGRLPPAATADPTETDQIAFELNDEQWAEFLKRMGFEGGAPADV
jgi:hypothetical protein